MTDTKGIKMKKLSLALFIAISLIALVSNGHTQGTRNTPLGFCALSSLGAATSLSSCSGGIPAGTSYAVICAYTQNVNWRDDGVAPTASVGTGGQQIQSNNCIPYNGNFTAFQAIQQNSSAILGITFYRAV